MTATKAAIAIAAALFTVGAGPRLHIELVSSVPAADSVLPVAPGELLLTFSTDVDRTRSGVTMRTLAGTSVKLGDVVSTGDPRQMRASILDQLEAGTYVVSWTAAPKDDHPGRGRFRFEIE